MNDIIDSRDLGVIDGFDVRAELVPDTDSSPDEYDCDDESVATFNRGDWSYVGVIVTVSREGVDLGEDSIWAVAYGYIPGVDKFISPLEDGPGWTVNGVTQPGTFANGYGAGLVRQAIHEAQQKLERINASLSAYSRARRTTMNDRELSRLTALLNDLQDARQAYDDAVVPEHPKLASVMESGNNLSNVAYELHNFLVLKLTRAGGP